MTPVGAPARRPEACATVGLRSRHRHLAFLRYTRLARAADPRGRARRQPRPRGPGLTLVAADAVQRASESIARIKRSSGDRLAHVLMHRALERLAEIDENLRFLHEAQDEESAPGAPAGAVSA